MAITNLAKIPSNGGLGEYHQHSRSADNDVKQKPYPTGTYSALSPLNRTANLSPQVPTHSCKSPDATPNAFKSWVCPPPRSKKNSLPFTASPMTLGEWTVTVTCDPVRSNSIRCRPDEGFEIDLRSFNGMDETGTNHVSWARQEHTCRLCSTCCRVEKHIALPQDAVLRVAQALRVVSH